MDPSDPTFQTLLVENTIDLLSELRDRTGMTAAIAVLSQVERRGEVLASLPGLSDHGYVPRVGFRFHLHSTAPGKSLLGHLPTTHRRRILKSLDFKRFTDRTYCDERSLDKHLRTCAQNRCVFDVGEYVDGVNCVASCVIDEEGRPLAAIWITALSVDLPEGQLSHYAKEVILTAKAMWNRLRDANNSTSMQHHQTMERAKKFIEQHFLDEGAVRHFHRTIGMSDSWFRKLFRDKYGIAPMSYRLQLLHERACRLLQNTKLSIKEIAFQLGYESQNYFSRTFKNTKGISPAHYRESLRS
ncbi:MAG: helix-turn-helix domain-containing protein [Opitutaceae bacterium]|jgi:DNA-binding IclR family transcriptional regulator/AraC-like DNA-binding protein|nr:helix-turn-helix domain-containing protein [Opitutaceae bacterium]